MLKSQVRISYGSLSRSRSKPSFKTNQSLSRRSSNNLNNPHNPSKRVYGGVIPLKTQYKSSNSPSHPAHPYQRIKNSPLSTSLSRQSLQNNNNSNSNDNFPQADVAGQLVQPVTLGKSASLSTLKSAEKLISKLKKNTNGK